MHVPTLDLQLGDCLDLMRYVPDKSIDCILCDPPYGTTRNKWDVVLPFELLWENYHRIIKDNGVIILFCDGMFTAELISSNRQYWRYNLVWDKGRGSDFLNANRKPMKSHEDIAVFYKKQPVFNKQYWYSTPYKRTQSHVQSSNYRPRKAASSISEDGRRNPLSVLAFPRESSRIFPTQKPVSLLSYLIRTYTNEGDTVLDNCMGSGSTGVACVQTNRRFIGMEMHEPYFSLASERIYHEVSILEDKDSTGGSETL